jgi:nicotinate phosphoribosyltransferase
MIFDELAPPNPGAWTMVDPLDMTRRKQIPAGTTYEDLLVPVFRDGSLVYHSPGIEAARARVKQDLAMLHEGIKRQTFPHTYPVGLERGLFERKAKMILELRGFDS